MPEEKKDSFTFSDKIKNSKPAGNKSFAKSSSKIGRDGKPKQTLFERTRRDAPFFIAALVALLLLPFLYKYSGQASEDALLTPGSEQTAFDPERYGFDTAALVEDPDGQIAQLSGRDSLSLIKGFGSDEEQDYARDDFDLDSSASSDYEGTGEYSADRSASTKIDEENNTTNIYKRRAGRATRAAFRRTKVGALSPAVWRRPGGSRLGIQPWGGGLKQAAKKVGSGPTSAPKPVSLQPLRAGDRARSSFGQGSAQAARKSRDAMGKANPLEALRDAYVKPLEPTRVGGLDAFTTGSLGGSGSLGHNINIGKGETPWWWDMMKTRMQKEWEARFQRKWDWIKWGDKLLQNILGNLLNCIITGDDSGDVDKFLGISAGGGSDPTCCGVTESKAASKTEITEAGGFEAWCKIKTNQAKLKAMGYNCSPSFKGGVHTDVALGPIASRLKCLGFNAGAYVSGSTGLKFAGLACDTMPNYNVIPEGQARKWNVYTYVVARNYFPDSLKAKYGFKDLMVRGDDGNPKAVNLLCSSMDRRRGGTSLNHNDPTAGVAHVKDQQTKARDLVIEQISSTESVPQEQQVIRERSLEVDQESLGDSCVIMVSRGNVLPYEAMKNQIIDLFKKLGPGISEADAEKAFFELDLMYVSSFASKHKLAFATWGETGHRLESLLPMPYWEFENAYIQHRKVTHLKNGSRDNVYKKKWRVEGVDMVRGTPCFYDNLRFECDPEEGNTATLHFDKFSFKGGRTEQDSRVKPSTDDVQVSAEFRYLDNGMEGAKKSVEQPMIKPDTSLDDGFTFKYTFDRIYDSIEAKHTGDAINTDGLVGNIIWTATRGKQVVTRTCPLNLSGDSVNPYIKKNECTDGDMEKSPDPKVEGQCQKQRVCKSGVWGAWENVPGDKDCDANPQGGVVHFYGKVTKEPCVEDVLNGMRRLQDSTGCLTWNTCKLTQDQALLLPLDPETERYVEAAKVKFDREKGNSDKNITLDYNKNSLSVANLVDAIMIDPDNGTVPANTVCLLGKTIGANARDPQAKSFDNIFGTFLAFIGYDAASFPSQRTYDCNGSGNVVRDLRFVCSSSYYWGGYVNQKERINYEKQVDAADSPWRGFPLKGLMRTPLPKNGNTMALTDKENRVRFHGDKPNGYADLLRREPCEYPTGTTVARKDVLEYINRLCQYGDQIKPKATKKYDCSKIYKDGAFHHTNTDCQGTDC